LWPRRGSTAGTTRTRANARDKNFAGLLPIWDVLFGTYYMPRDRRPCQFGTASAVPVGLIGQMLFPFRRG
jgi:sterol desaturase/sphingolipid hydroxylase (fatty acid hydroxylase superfamily)